MRPDPRLVGGCRAGREQGGEEGTCVKSAFTTGVPGGTRGAW